MRRLCLVAAITLAVGLGAEAQAATRGRGEVGSRVQKPRISALYNTACAVPDDGRRGAGAPTSRARSVTEP